MKNKNKKLIALLQEAYAAELETVANYIANSVWLDGLRAEEVKESLEEDVAEELEHARMLAKRIKLLGGRPPGSLELKTSQKTLQPPEDSTDMRSVIVGVLEAEQQAIDTYRRIIKACDGVDFVTQDLAVRILADEEEHHNLFAGFLKSLDK
ncbi:ferritin-like domain-containing protein [Opitutales bacterium ASA1]|uniref:ferritin-like domain-containing protein n=1 Tax=Congregicoccus parvus TaxID=3081749 RepID=UPI002B314343|nr:ferritin-like domain-containing protein [Opitutales bacterium ASA1]